MTGFMFATGVEISAPVIAGGKRLDEYEARRGALDAAAGLRDRAGLAVLIVFLGAVGSAVVVGLIVGVDLIAAGTRC